MNIWETKAICPLVQDLLPSLTDGITLPATEQILREHMKTCETCQKLYADMSPDTVVYPAETEDIPVETFVKKLRFRKWLLGITVSILVIAMTGVTVYAVASSRFFKMQYLDEVSIWGPGYMLSNSSQPVSIAVDGALYHNTQRDYSEDDPDGHTTFVWDTFKVFTDDFTCLFEEMPYTNSLNGWIPVEEDGTIRSLLGVYNEQNMVDEFTFHGNLYSMDRMQDFLLYKFNEDGSFYIVCYPCTTETEALETVQKYVETFDLQDSYLWKYVTEHYADQLN